MQEFHWLSGYFFQHFKRICFLMSIEISQLVDNISDLCLFVFGIQNFSGVALQPVFSEEFIFSWYEGHIFHSIKVLESRPLGGYKSLHFSISVIKFNSCFNRKVLPRITSYLTLSFANAKAFCWPIHLFLLNWGRREARFWTTIFLA